MKLEIYSYIYNQFGHPDYKHIHKRISANFYIINITKGFCAYFYYCYLYKVLFIPKHLFYGLLQFILILSHIFYIIIINFILVSFTSIPDQFNYALLIINKLLQETIIIPGKTIWINIQ